MICGTKISIKFDIVVCLVEKLILNTEQLCRTIDISKKWTIALIKIPRIDIFSNKIVGFAWMKWYDFFSDVDLKAIEDSLINGKC